MSRTTNVIQRRELGPLLVKAQKIKRHYEKAADCAVCILGPDCESAEKTQDSANVHFCSLCNLCRRKGGPAVMEKSCFVTHLDAVNNARQQGGSYIYICPAGFVFWTSPFYSGERFAGALLSGGVLAVEKGQAVENILHNCGWGMQSEEIKHVLSIAPKKNGCEVKALAQMMLICADQISGIMTHSGLSASLNMETGKKAEIEPENTESPVQEKALSPNSDSNLLDKERILLATLRRGDNGEAQKILKELLEILYRSTKGNFPGFRLKAMELAVLLSRAVNNPEDFNDGSILETNNHYLKKIEEGRSLKEITGILAIIIDRMSGKIFSFQGIRHSSALRKAERYIWDNYTRKISLKEIAGASGLSAPYFSTIFKNEMGENLSNYLNRLRVEKATTMLVTTNIPISGISAACGFEDQSWFSKIFRVYTGLSPGKYREQGGNFS